MGSYRIYYAQNWLCAADAARLGAQEPNRQWFTPRLGQTNEEQERIRALERENHELRKAIQVVLRKDGFNKIYLAL
tara:strand:- start:2431 stop:2658 length:228 start_codon:yes stop_codon:yes gene_type:complete